MMNIKELIASWKEVVRIYEEDDRNNPDIAAGQMAESIGIDRTLEVFATIARIKRHDMRISTSNRMMLSGVEVNPEACIVSPENRVLYAGIDAIHTAHLDQLITSLLKIKERSNA